MLSKNKPFSTMIFFISCCDLLGSLANCIGFPQSGSISCSVQAFFCLFFIPASWLWTTVLVYQLRNLIIFKQISLTMTQVHAICWIIPLIISLLPLTTNPYGQDDFINGYSPCILGGNATSKLLWISTCDSGLFLILVILMTIWTIQISKYLFSVNATDFTGKEREKSLVASMKLYPMALLFTWAPRFIEGLLNLGGHVIGKSVLQIIFIPALILSTLYGAIVAIIFFSKSPAVRALWYNLFKRMAYQHCRIRDNRTSLDDSSYNFNNHYSNNNNNSSSDSSNGSRPQTTLFQDETDEVFLLKESTDVRVSIIVEMQRPSAMDGRTSHEIR